MTRQNSKPIATKRTTQTQAQQKLKKAASAAWRALRKIETAQRLTEKAMLKAHWNMLVAERDGSPKSVVRSKRARFTDLDRACDRLERDRLRAVRAAHQAERRFEVAAGLKGA
jgi:hypothetical protein